MSGIQSGKPQLEDGRILTVERVIWATGFQPDYRWISMPIFDDRGYPLHSRGVVKGTPGPDGFEFVAARRCRQRCQVYRRSDLANQQLRDDAKIGARRSDLPGMFLVYTVYPQSAPQNFCYPLEQYKQIFKRLFGKGDIACDSS
jgi:hypothetical protein